jgi:hypothetical protein
MLVPTRRYRNSAHGATRRRTRTRPQAPAWLLQAPVLLEFVTVLELSLLAAFAIRVVWLQSEDRPSAVAFGFLLAIVIARCWRMWWSAARDPNGNQ